MASLPPGWTADYDGQRWFFTYGPTGQSQFQFPRPGDEFPDLLLCCAGGGDAGPAAVVELMPEERLESERQVRRVLNAGGGSGGSGSTGEVVVEGEGGLRESGGDGGSTVCFGNFAAVKSRGRQGWDGGREEGTRNARQGERCVDEGVDIKRTTGAADVSRESSGEPVSIPLVVKGRDSRTDWSPYQGEGSAATISIMSEPVLAVIETTAVALSTGYQGEHQLATVAQPSPPELPMPDGRAVESVHTPPWVVPVGLIPELYSESTALCEEEINPPPVELPGHEGGWNGQTMVPKAPVQSLVELPACEAFGVSPGNGSRIAQLEPKCLASKYFVGEYATTSTAGRGESPGAKIRGHDRAGLPSQASRIPSEKSFSKNSLRERVNSAPDQKPPTMDTDHPTEKAGADRRDLTHIPSILRPGPRRAGQQRPPPSTAPAPITNTAQATAHVRLRQHPRGRQHEEQVEACQVSQAQPASMPAMPLEPHPAEPQKTAPAASPAAPQPGGARQERLPGSVNFVIPIRHMSSDDPHSTPDNAAAGRDSPEYRVGASFASATSPEQSPVAGGRDSVGDPGLVPGRKTESWGWRADEAVPARLVSSKPAPGVVPDWSWGWAR